MNIFWRKDEERKIFEEVMLKLLAIFLKFKFVTNLEIVFLTFAAFLFRPHYSLLTFLSCPETSVYRAISHKELQDMGGGAPEQTQPGFSLISVWYNIVCLTLGLLY